MMDVSRVAAECLFVFLQVDGIVEKLQLRVDDVEKTMKVSQRNSLVPHVFEP